MEVNLRDKKIFLSAFKYYKKSLEEDPDVKIFLNLILNDDVIREEIFSPLLELETKLESLREKKPKDKILLNSNLSILLIEVLAKYDDDLHKLLKKGNCVDTNKIKSIINYIESNYLLEFLRENRGRYV